VILPTVAVVAALEPQMAAKIADPGERHVDDHGEARDADQ
jgi:hypothetical protein